MDLRLLFSCCISPFAGCTALRSLSGRGLLSFTDLLYLFHDILQVLSCKQNLRLFRHLRAALIQAEFVGICIISLPGIELLQNPLRRFRHIRLKKRCSYGNALREIVQNRRQSVLLCLILGECPRHGFINVFIAALEECKNLGNRIRNVKSLHLFLDLARSLCDNRLQLIVHGIIHIFVLDNSAEIFI